MPHITPYSEYTVRSTCRLCGGNLSGSLVYLGSTALANEYADETSKEQDEFQLYLVQCLECDHVQLPVVVNPERLFRNYKYVSGTSPMMRRHLSDYSREIVERAGWRPLNVLEIGSNDGTLLREILFRDPHAHVLGVDPAVEIAGRATYEGTLTLPTFFGPKLVPYLRAARPAGFGVVVANNVFAHIDDLNSIAASVSAVLHDNGIFVFEVGYLADVLDRGLVDVIYHEHLSYHHLMPLVPFLARHGLRVFDAHRTDVQGGSLRVWASKDVWRPISSRVSDLLGAETDMDPERLTMKIELLRGRVTSALRGSVACFGAPAKLTTLTSIIGLCYDVVYDDNPHKLGKYTPGWHVPIVSSERLAQDNPDTLLIASWNFATEIIERVRGWGYRGRIVVPLPEVQVL